MITGAVLAASALSMATSPAQAAGADALTGAIKAADGWNFTAAAVCLQEVAVVPVLGNYIADHANNCSNGNVLDHAGG